MILTEVIRSTLLTLILQFSDRVLTWSITVLALNLGTDRVVVSDSTNGGTRGRKDSIMMTKCVERKILSHPWDYPSQDKYKQEQESLELCHKPCIISFIYKQLNLTPLFWISLFLPFPLGKDPYKGKKLSFSIESFY